MRRIYNDGVPYRGVFEDMQAPRRPSDGRSDSCMFTGTQRHGLCTENAPSIPLRLPDSITRGVSSSACEAGMTMDMALKVSQKWLERMSRAARLLGRRSTAVLQGLTRHCSARWLIWEARCVGDGRANPRIRGCMQTDELSLRI